MSGVEEFINDAEASVTIPTQASALRIGGYVVMKSAPCKIIEMTTSKTGKHGGAKISIIAIEIFTDRKHETHFMSTETVEVPIVNKYDYQLIEIDGEGFMTLMCANSQMREDIRLPDNELGRQIRFAHESGDELNISTIKSMHREQPTGFTLLKH